MTQSQAGHDLPPAMSVQLPAEVTVAHPSLLHGRDDAGLAQSGAPLGIRQATQRPQPVGTVQELLGLPGLRGRQVMPLAKMPFRVVCRALFDLWLAKDGWLGHGPFRLRGLVAEPHLQRVRQKSVLGD